MLKRDVRREKEKARGKVFVQYCAVSDDRTEEMVSTLHLAAAAKHIQTHTNTYKHIQTHANKAIVIHCISHTNAFKQRHCYSIMTLLHAHTHIYKQTNINTSCMLHSFAFKLKKEEDMRVCLRQRERDKDKTWREREEKCSFFALFLSPDQIVMKCNDESRNLCHHSCSLTFSYCAHHTLNIHCSRSADSAVDLSCFFFSLRKKE